MRIYLEYEKYQELGGTLDETTFNEFAFDATGIIDWYTFGRLRNEEELPKEIAPLMYKLIKILVEKERALQLANDPSTGSSSGESGKTVTPIGKSIVSQSNDGVSVSYNVVNATSAYDIRDKQISRAIYMALDGVYNSLGRGLLYRGLYPGEQEVYPWR